MRRTIQNLLRTGLLPALALVTACSNGSSPVSPVDPVGSPAPPTSAPALGEVRMSTPASGSGTVPFHDWALALHNELYPVTGISETFETLDLARLYGDHVGSPFATNALGRIEARVPGGTSGETLRMRGGSVAYVVIRSDRGATAVDLDYRAPSSAGLQVATVRIR